MVVGVYVEFIEQLNNWGRGEEKREEQIAGTHTQLIMDSLHSDCSHRARATLRSEE